MSFSSRSILVPIYRRMRNLKDSLVVARVKARGLQVGSNVKIHGRMHVDVSRGSCVVIANGVIFNALVNRNTLEARGFNIIKTLNANAVLRIGERTGITSSTISVAEKVEIGERVLIGSGVLITDSDHHVVSPADVRDRRNAGLPDPRSSHAITIEDDVFIGARSIILKGVTIGRGSVIGAGSVVSKNIPEGVVAAGNPCLPIKILKAAS